MINKTSLTAQHIVKIDVSKIVKYLSKQTQDVLKEELHSDDLNDIEVGTTIADGYIYFLKKLEY